MEFTKDNAEKWKNKRNAIPPIGVTHSDHIDHKNTPIHRIFNSSIGYIEVLEEFSQGLAGNESFSQISALYFFHMATGKNLVQKPFLDDEKDRGVFTIRHFNQPNPIGPSIIQHLGVDAIYGTSLLDIKSYVWKIDHCDEVKTGWVDNQHMDDIVEWNSPPKKLRNRERVLK